MKKNPVINMKNRPNGYDLVGLFCLVTCLHYWNAPLWLIISLPSFFFLMSAIRRSISVEIDIFEGLDCEPDSNKEQKEYQSKFQERLAKLYEERKAKNEKQ